ncbi:MAG TPA: hypothetical protein VMZ11_00680 [Mycobacteriales bacterium]|nr:hypothetical protein [Mycobacteriales bacterium]
MSLLRRLVLLLALEGVLLALLGIGYGVAGLRDDSERAPTELAAGIAVVVGVVLLLLARAVSRGRGWARSPAVVLNLLPLPVAAGAFQAGAWWAGLPVVLLAGTVLYLFATPELRDAFRET